MTDFGDLFRDKMYLKRHFMVRRDVGRASFSLWHREDGLVHSVSERDVAWSPLETAELLVQKATDYLRLKEALARIDTEARRRTVAARLNRWSKVLPPVWARRVRDA